MGLRNKRILITAGPTWVPIDNIRVISNTATGKTGILLAENLQKNGAKVSLLLGPVESGNLNKKIKLIPFKFFGELKDLVKRELHSNKFDVIIHSAAVSDYRPSKIYSYKIKSSYKNFTLNLVPTEKIINIVKKIEPSLFLVGFKFEPRSSKNGLINKARILIRSSGADLVVANTSYNGRYNAYIVSQKKVSSLIRSRNELVKILISKIGD